LKIHLLAVGTRMPAWVSDGYDQYARRMPPDCRLELTEIPAVQRGKNADIKRIVEQEGKKLLTSAPKKSQIIALNTEGKSWSTEQLAQQLDRWMQQGSDLALLVGGPEGLHTSCLQAASQQWSLSPLTFPHPLVRIIVAEQLYRAVSLLRGHPYHRA
jgi:23S rRNA (pseudouridine1915-N3)-methyltransferase